MARRTPIISITINDGLPNVSNENIQYGSTVILKNTDTLNVDAYDWKIISKPPSSNTTLSFISWSAASSSESLGNIQTSFTADAYGTYIVELTLNRIIKGRIGVAVKSPHLGIRIPAAEEKNEFDGWATAIYNTFTTMEDGYATLSSATGTGAVSGDLYGSLPSPTVIKLQGRSVSSSSPSINQALVWSGSAWAPTNVLSSGSTASGDLSGTFPSPTVAKLQGRTLDSSSPSATDVLAWDGVKWTPTTPGAPGAHASTHENSGTDEIDVTGLSGVLADAQNAGQLRGYTISSSAPASGQILSWNGSQWAPVSPTTASHTMGGSSHITDTLASINNKVSDQNLLGTLTTFGGDVSGGYSNLTVAKLRGRTVDSSAPSATEVLAWDGSKWTPTAAGGPPNGNASGDLDGTYPSPTVAGLRGAPISNSVAPSDGWILAWDNDGYEWVPEAQSGTSSGDGYDLIFSDDTEFTETGTSPSTKKTFRVVMDSINKPSKWRVVVSLWTASGSDTAQCTISIGGDSTVLSTSSSSETVLSGWISVTASADTLLTANIQLNVASGTDTAHVKYTDIYAVKDGS